MNIAEWTLDHLRRYPDELALINSAWTCTNQQLFHRSSRFAGALLRLGVRPGDRVAVALPNGADLYLVAEGVLQAGMVLVVLGENTPSDLARRIEHCSAQVLVTGSTSAQTCIRLLSPAAPRLSSDFELAELLAMDAPLEHPMPRSADDPAQLVYTSGTTEEPKAAIYTHGRIDAFLRGRRALLSGNARAEAVLVAVPPTAFGSRFISMRAVVNQHYVLFERFEPEAVLAAIETHRVRSMPLLPTLAQQWVMTRCARRYDCSSLRAINISGARVSATLVNALKEMLKQHGLTSAFPAERRLQVLVHYGMTETGGGIASSERGGTPGEASVGVPVEGVEVRIVGDHDIDCAPGQVGEVWARTPYAATAYWNDPQRSAAVFRDGYVRTGDLGYFNPAGELCLAGRLKEVISQGGYKVLPMELATVIERLPGVAECAVIGIDDELLGEAAVACIVTDPGATLTRREILERLAGTLEPRKFPGQIVFLDRLPRTPVGKPDLRVLPSHIIERRAAAAAVGSRWVQSAVPQQRTALVHQAVLDALLESLPRQPPAPLDPEMTFGEAGLDSIGSVRFALGLSERLGVRLAATAIYQHPTIASLCATLESRLWRGDPLIVPAVTPEAAAIAPEPIAIVGMGCRVPGAQDPDSFWRLVEGGRDAIRPVPHSRRPAGGNAWRGGFLDSIEQFDARFFRLEGHAANLDPRHRMVLEVTWEACEDGGQDPLRLPAERTGVFMGVSGERYVSADPLGRSPGMGVGYLCQFFDLRGPVLSIDTTCSSSLVALHTAVCSLRRGECDVALAGGANLLAAPADPDSGVVSPEGRSRAFAADANGFGQGEGCVVFLLRRLSAAQTNRDRIYAVILGTAINHDGRSSSLTAPNPKSQAAVIRRALQEARVTPDEVQYLEAHGTGTALGDPIEVEALAEVFRDRATAPLAIGSVKTNIGHLEAAAGAAGVAKVALSMAHDRLAPSLHCTTPNPRIPWDRIPLHVQTSAAPWPNGRSRRIAGISSFGMSGTNAHAVVAQAPESGREEPAGAEAGSLWLLPISAKTPRSLRARAARWAAALDNELSHSRCVDIAYTASCRRAHLEHRAVAIGRNRAEWIAQLRNIASGRPAQRPPGVGFSRARLAIVFGGQGAHWGAVGRKLFEREPVFREAILDCARWIEPYVPWRLVETLGRGEPAITSAEVLQPCTFAVQFALWTLWRSWGVTPDTVFGHSVGEISAACASGALRLKEAAWLACRRGSLVQQFAAPGAMLHVALDWESAEKWCAQSAGRIEVAAINAPRATTLSGDPVALAELRDTLLLRGIEAKRLSVDRAYHSVAMADAAARLTETLAGWMPRKSQIPLLSTLTGTIDPTLDAEYWGRQLRSPVRFLEAATALLDDGYTVFLELSPQPIVQPILRAIAEEREPRTDVLVTASLRRGHPEQESLVEALGDLYRAGVLIDWSTRYASAGTVVSLPSYAWDHGPSESDEVESPSPGDERLREWLATFIQLPQERIAEDSTLGALGMDSIDIMQFRARLAADLGVHIPAAMIGPETSLASLRAQVRQPKAARATEDAPAASVRLTRLRSSDTELHHVWIHPAGGGIEHYRQLAALLPHDCTAVQCIAVAADGQPDSVESLAARYTALLAEHNIRAPFVVGGWSFGGLVAYEMARQQSHSLPLVILIDSYVFGDAAAMRPVADRALDIRAKQEFLAQYSVHTDTRGLPDDEVERLYDVLRSNLIAAGGYRPLPYDGAVVSIRASRHAGDPDASWRTLVRNFHCEAVIANHFSIMESPALGSVADLVRAYLERVRTTFGYDSPDRMLARMA